MKYHDPMPLLCIHFSLATEKAVLGAGCLVQGTWWALKNTDLVQAEESRAEAYSAAAWGKPTDSEYTECCGKFIISSLVHDKLTWHPSIQSTEGKTFSHNCFWLLLIHLMSVQRYRHRDGDIMHFIYELKSWTEKFKGTFHELKLWIEIMNWEI